MLSELRKILPERLIRDRYIDLVSFASDAGFYHLVPKAVVQPETEEQITLLSRFARRHGIPLVFRTGGTSLSGQSITDGILVDLSLHWKKISIEDEGARVRVQPGITGAMVNAYLKKQQRKIGPDPSSISAAMIGGILSNNASGMCCGVKQNSYHTVRHLRFMLPDGNFFNTENESDYARFETACPDLCGTLKAIRRDIWADALLFEKIRKKYQAKTTIGYSLNAFIDYEHPLDILAHLLIGAEGTLAFIAEAVLDTVPDYPHKATALLYFPTIAAACEAIRPLTDLGAMMVELMDRASLRAVENLEGMPAIVKTLPDAATALLIEFQENSPEAVDRRVEAFLAQAPQLSLLNTPIFTTEAGEQQFLWKVRKGLFPAVGAVRASGTTVVLEDVAFPIEKLGEAIADLQALFRQHRYENAIIFGHAKDGNIHFVVTQSFNSQVEIDRYDAFIRDVVDMVLRHEGTLKAEHGTGRNMAPFVETEWGGDAYAIIKRIKNAVDPQGIFNPGVIVNDDPDVHIKNLKSLPAVESEVDRCIECGYCEHRCPSRDLTATPRRRIVLRRALKNLELSGDKRQHRALAKAFRFEGLDSCAVDGLCATACPVDINTGDLVKRLRRENHSPAANTLALVIARQFKSVEWMVRNALRLGAKINATFGSGTMTGITQLLRKAIPALPVWPADARPPAKLRPNIHTSNSGKAVVYFPACISRAMGTYAGEKKDLMETFGSVCAKAGIDMIVPRDIYGSCCGQIFSSKGFLPAYAFTARKIMRQLWESTRQGALPVVTDVSSCAYTLKTMRGVLDEGDQLRFDQLTILDSVDFLHDMVVPVVGARANTRNIVLHPVCSLEKMKTQDKFIRVARHFANQVTVPKSAGCCGMAGDRGFLFPQLTLSATLQEAREVQSGTFDGCYSSTKTCEIALSEAVKANYMSILYLADEMMIPLHNTDVQ
ncbi:FAD-binding and (Fe-S)-binding domain-containing protein [Chitinophaga pollutisoli]|uniref:D-lactate dehydrogenase (cytochrome) n=1 Tax=Chitinophaga pollutisoli TaxID=3133966 RepID=A0ABZ2YSZ5_9BACT